MNKNINQIINIDFLVARVKDSKPPPKLIFFLFHIIISCNHDNILEFQPIIFHGRYILAGSNNVKFCRDKIVATQAFGFGLKTSKFQHNSGITQFKLTA